MHGDDRTYPRAVLPYHIDYGQGDLSRIRKSAHDYLQPPAQRSRLARLDDLGKGGILVMDALSTDKKERI